MHFDPMEPNSLLTSSMSDTLKKNAAMEPNSLLTSFVLFGGLLLQLVLQHLQLLVRLFVLLPGEQESVKNILEHSEQLLVRSPLCFFLIWP